MKNNIIFFDLKDALLLHDKATKRYNSSSGVRDKNLLESAMYQAQITVFGAFACKDIYEMAAAYAYHIIKNHPFVDGNKRTGLLIALTFLKTNGYFVKTDQDSIYKLGIMIAESKISKPEIATFFKTHAVAVKKKT